MTALGDMRTRLRLATSEAHERLHGHPGFAAAAAGKISMADYRLLLSRLFGFHLAFEIALAARESHRDASDDLRPRSALIAADLETLGLERREIERLPLCEGLSSPRSEAERLGALYVLEGSTLGGRQIARALEPVVDRPGSEGRRFFLGYGESHGAMWRAFLEQIETLANHPAASSEAVNSANQTFKEFERWMRDWKSIYSVANCVEADPA